ncbi:hypothetical protein ANME2D_02907 [Candidatus Methanoperedens nitroreducens]|uniref:Fervidolysin-like N-terminal prodomain domain-containing protein n=1 Tax=Candidatus Methanoperedens nitratireducens TaxID=1392998 RepID=A0A062UV35_9EURY|nr:hypothetical protein [Candidatus Methanoperedens nitroreducens]KCZ70881.1 hypothetical protein ANME2D_02907 [Candidatus Methanoperedens nitroreducens]MDJ1421751.1 hypothetical protein [Candidatus Methanoperedens sp.]
MLNQVSRIVLYVLPGIFALVLLSNAAVSTSWATEAGEIPYQVNNSDRIITGTVKELYPGLESTDVIISVVEIASNDSKIRVMLPGDAEVIAIEKPSYTERKDIYDVIFRWNNSYGVYHDTITVNLTSKNVEGAVSIRVKNLEEIPAATINVEDAVSIRSEYQPEVEDLPMPVFREAVVVYFREMPASLDEFASRYGGKLIFTKHDIKMAAFETNPISIPAQTSQQTLDFINRISTDSSVEKAYRDEFEFIRSDKEYSPEPRVMYPEDMRDEYVPDQVIVGFWRFPPSLDEFASKHEGKLKNFDDANNVLKSALFETNNITEFIKKVSTDPYVRYAEPNGIVRIAGVLENNTTEAVNTPKTPGFGTIPAAGLLLLIIYLMKRRD